MTITMMRPKLRAAQAAVFGLVFLLSACDLLGSELVLAPETVTLEAGQTQTFEVSGDAEGIFWEASGGEVLFVEGKAAVYKAPQVAATYTLTARDETDPLHRATARIEVVTPSPEPISVSIAPSSVSLQAGAKQPFSVQVTGGDASRVTWQATGGSVEGSGQTVTYTAPMRAGTFELSVTSLEDPAERAVAAILVEEPVPSTKVVAVGDIVCSPFSPKYNGGNGTDDECRMKYTAELTEALAPDAVLALGDLQYSDGRLSEFRAAYEPTWGRFKAITYPIPGNHEYANSSASGYYDYFGEIAGDRDKGYYETELGSWQLVALNTNTECSVVECARGSDQERWLREVLDDNPERCTLAMMHHPQFSSGQRDQPKHIGDLWDALYDAGADIILAAHDHHYERFALQDGRGRLDPEGGVRFFIVGTGGKSLYAPGEVDPNSEVRVFGTYGVLHLDLKEDRYDWAFVTESGETLDEGSESCR